MRKLVYGVGINDSFYQVYGVINGSRAVCPIYIAWAGMLKRVFSDRYQELSPSYKGCSVCDEWLLFSNFRLWMVCQDWEGKQLDKDILSPGNRMYSPETCCFVDNKLNSLLCISRSNKGLYPTGVSFHKSRDEFRANITINGKQKHLGAFSNPEDANSAYIKAKAEEIRRQGRVQTDPRIMTGLFRHAYLLEQQLA